MKNYPNLSNVFTENVIVKFNNILINNFWASVIRGQFKTQQETSYMSLCTNKTFKIYNTVDHIENYIKFLNYSLFL